jgi:uncharacterized protein YyaL (SSP411 family)
MAQAYREERDKVMENVLGLVEGLDQVDRHYRGRAAAGPLAASALIAAGRQIVDRTDATHGGLAGAPKFPSSSAHELLARVSRLGFGAPAREAFVRWADHMAAGGLYDHLGGGFARYSVDEQWAVPHFEKMLYDQGQLLGVYADGFALTGAPRYREVIAETVAYLGRELSDPAGGLWASQDADSEGVEGKYYVWTPAEVRAALGFVDALQFCKAYGVTTAGNFEHGTTVLARVGAPGSRSDEDHLATLRARLREARSVRVAPATDDKVLAAWNGLAITGLVRAWQATDHAPALALAQRVGDFLVAHMIDGDRLARVYKAGATKLDGTLEDYAFVAAALFELGEATARTDYWQAGARLTAAIRARFYDPEDGGRFLPDRVGRSRAAHPSPRVAPRRRDAVGGGGRGRVPDPPGLRRRRSRGPGDGRALPRAPPRLRRPRPPGRGPPARRPRPVPPRPVRGHHRRRRRRGPGGRGPRGLRPDPDRRRAMGGGVGRGRQGRSRRSGPGLRVSRADVRAPDRRSGGAGAAPDRSAQ